jgi:hypothetical protein
MYLTFILPSALLSGEVHDLAAHEGSPFYWAVKVALIGSSAPILVRRCTLGAKLLREPNVVLPASATLFF